jgi:5-oxoprolinase (ATP-hydrolysing) subunit A
VADRVIAPAIDLNSDLGENTADRVVSDDDAMLGIVSSANVSCGFHAGSPEGIRATLADAVRRGVVIGAHPGYRDYEGFGRETRDVESGTLQAEIEYQLGAIIGLARAVGGRVRYVKPHGALYNRIVHDAEQARAVVDAVRAIDPALVVLGLPGAEVLAQAERAGLATAAEAFADRAYAPSGALLPRTAPGAVLHDPQTVATRMLRLAREGVIEAADGSLVRVRADSICVHGDSPGAIAIARAVRGALESEGIRIAPFAGAA